MDSLSTVTGKMLYIIHCLYKDANISKKDKSLLKGRFLLKMLLDLLFDNRTPFEAAYRNYQTDGT